MNIDFLKEPFIGFLIAKGVQVTVEELFPPLTRQERQNLAAQDPQTRYTLTSGLYPELRKKIRFLYETKIDWKKRGEFYSFVGSTFPMTIAYILFFEKDPSFRRQTLLSRWAFYALFGLGGLHVMQYGFRMVIRAISAPFPKVIYKAAKRIACPFYPVKVVFEPTNKRDYILNPKHHSERSFFNFPPLA